MAWWRARRELVVVVGISSAIGAGVGLAVAGDTVRGLAQGALSGALVSLAARAIGPIVERTGLERRPFGVYVAVSAVVNALTIVAALAVAALPWALAHGSAGLDSYRIPFAVACLASLGFTAWFSLDRLLGQGVLVGLLTGRYHRPRIEERIFLFADLVDSTALAERLGGLRFHSFLNRLWSDLAPAVQRHGGTIHRYIGDQLEVTWSVERGRRNASCLRCASELLRAVSEASPVYAREYDVVPRLRLALHAGPVVVGELGAVKRDIAYSGDTLNTTSRIEGVAKQIDADMVVSADLLRGLDLPAGLAARPLGPRRLRGKQREVELFVVEPPPAGVELLARGRG